MAKTLQGREAGGDLADFNYWSSPPTGSRPYCRPLQLVARLSPTGRRYTCGMAQPTLPPPGFDELSPDEKLEYIQALWDHFSEHPEEVPVPDWHRQVVAERLAAHRRGEITSRPWPEVREELLARLRSTR